MTAAQEMLIIQLITGDSAISHRRDVGEYVIGSIRADQDGVMWAGWSYERTALGHGGAAFSVIYQDVTLSDCWVCWSDHADDDLWAEAEIRAPAGVCLPRPVWLPWLAVAVRADPALLPDVIALSLADAARCVGWAFVADQPGL